MTPARCPRCGQILIVAVSAPDQAAPERDSVALRLCCAPGGGCRLPVFSNPLCEGKLIRAVDVGGGRWAADWIRVTAEEYPCVYSLEGGDLFTCPNSRALRQKTGENGGGDGW